jgi:hypothetical protein
MRIPSRRMPKLAPHTWDGKALLVAAVALAVLAAFGITMVAAAPAATLGVVALGVVVSVVLSRRRRHHLRSLAAARHGESICEFAREFNAREVDPWIVRAVYEELQNELADYCPSFPIRAGDLLQPDLLDDPDALDMSIAPAVAQRTGRTLDGADRNPMFGRVHTVRDLVVFFNSQPKSAA